MWIFVVFFEWFFRKGGNVKFVYFENVDMMKWEVLSMIVVLLKILMLVKVIMLFCWLCNKIRICFELEVFKCDMEGGYDWFLFLKNFLRFLLCFGW